MSESLQNAAPISSLLAAMPSSNASDIFLCEGRPPAARVHGSIIRLKQPPTTRAQFQHFIENALTSSNLHKFQKRGDLDVGYSLSPTLRFRLNLSLQQGRMAIVARALPSGALEMESLGIPSCVGSFANLARGLVLVTGATGSGKSTTLASLIHRINKTRPVHIITIEDPIEFVHSDIRARLSQREIGSDTKDYGTALRHLVRQSPDVILIGEMRDQETISVAISAALTGHLVFATLHTIDSSQTLQRILSYYPEHLRNQVSMDLSLSLKGVISQRLLPNINGDGRVLASEVLTINPAAIRLIREQRVDELGDLMKSSNDPSVISFNQSLLKLFNEKKITFDMGKAYATNPDEFALEAQGMATRLGRLTEDDSLEALMGLDMKALLEMARNEGASDLHITVGRPPILRVDGKLTPMPVKPLTAGDMRTLLYSILNSRQRERYQLELEIDFALATADGERFRVNAYYQKGHMAASLRAISSEIPTADQLGLPKIVRELGKKPQGLLLVVGPTGSGKTTTLSCLIDQINHSRACRIITVEDPVEFVHENDLATIDQRELGYDTKSFSHALKYVLRQDPDVILVGEMRDLETIGAALTAAETGHLVFATLHTNDAVQAIDRIIDVFPPHQQDQVRTQLAASLIGIVSQRLLSRADDAGRIAAFEVLVANPAVRNLIRSNKLHQISSIMETSTREGNQTMDAALKSLYERRLVNYSEAERYITSSNRLSRRGQGLV